MDKKLNLCPSSPLYEGSKLIGIVNTEGEVDILVNPIEINSSFIESAKKGRLPEERFRFLNKCIKNGCEQWTDESCGVIKRLIQNTEKNKLKVELPECSIRSECRWFQQEGSTACKICPLVKYI